MDDAPPKVCIGLAVRNAEATLPEALDCLLRQSFREFEVIVSDDASTDSTLEIARLFAARDRRVECTRTDRRIGGAANRNRVFRLGRSPYFGWLEAGDLPAPGWLERCVHMLDDDPGLVFAHTAFRPLDLDGRGLEPEPPRHPAEAARAVDRIRDLLGRGRGPATGPGLMRTEALRQTGLDGGFDGADAVLLAELALLGRFRQDDDVLCACRSRGREPERRLPPRVGLAALRAIAASPLGGLQRLWCMGAAALR